MYQSISLSPRAARAGNPGGGPARFGLIFFGSARCAGNPGGVPARFGLVLSGSARVQWSGFTYTLVISGAAVFPDVGVLADLGVIL